MTPVEAVLARVRDVATDEHDKGARFEQLMLHAFQTDRTFAAQFERVWLWDDWPGRTGTDIGVDLVALNTDGSYTAIQCKCWAADRRLTLEEISTFLGSSAQQQFARRIIVSTTDLWTENAERAMAGQAVPVERIGIDALDAMTVDWSSYDVDNPSGLAPTARHELRDYQRLAVDEVLAGFESTDRGKLIMACGTGKTFTALRLAEEQAGPGSAVLFLAPSIALVSQSLKEWTGECVVPIRPFAVCSDETAGRRLEGENATPYDLSVPPTTDPEVLIEAGAHERVAGQMTVVFSTYQSIEVIAALQARTSLRFDLVICDEAHRTAGISRLEGADRAFGMVHDDAIIPAAKRLYMTATPKIFKPVAIDAAREADAEVASMDEETIFGPELHRLGFGDAVRRGLLADYRVLILTVDQAAISDSFQELLSTNDNLNLPDVAKFVGCLSGLAKLPGASGAGFRPDERAMQRAVAFWSKIDESEQFAEQFEQVAEAYFDHLSTGPDAHRVTPISVPTRHVDGTTTISSRRTDIRWLKEEPPERECRVLTNAKCLTEGVDVPALDAVMFLTPRRSKIDIVQAVGRVMRKPPGKELGYVILPVAISSSLDPAGALDKNKDYEAVWEVLQALRAHDERFNAYINRISLSSREPGSGPDDPIQVIDVDTGTEPPAPPEQGRLFTSMDWSSAIYARIVQKVGTRRYWEDWATKVAAIAARHEARITSVLANQPAAAEAFDDFHAELRSTLNDGIDRDDAISMVSQHLITRPIFEALFGDEAFAGANPVSAAMTGIVEVLDEHSLGSETADLEGFYRAVRESVEGIHPDDGEARQKIIKDLYGRFFKIAFPKVADSLGIVYTPIEVVDFIIRATEAVLAEHFDGASLSDEGVHVLDPFTGTGTFVARLLQSGFIVPDDLERKFSSELHANELLLLAYYIAAVNIEATYRQERARRDGADPGYSPFPGIVLTDTFQLGETGDATGRHDVFPVNNDRATKQRALDIRVILGNPPYSSGQDSANDNNANLSYPNLDASITGTYARRSTAKLKNSLYDSYVRAIRWASDRLLHSPDGGVVAFVTNGGFIDNNAFDGFRLSVASEFHHIYVFNLRGNQRTAGEVSRREGGKIFDAGSRAPVGISLLVKEPGPVPAGGGTIHYRDVGEYLSRTQKLEVLARALPAERRAPQLDDLEWTTLEPNEHGDWTNQRSDTFDQHLSVHASDEPSIFELRTRGLLTSRDAWNYNSSLPELDRNVDRMIEHFNAETARFLSAHPDLGGTAKQRAQVVKDYVDLDATKFSWDRADFTDAAQGKYLASAHRFTMQGEYRPFHRRWAEAGRRLCNTVYQLPKAFPTADAENLLLGVLDPGGSAPFTTLMTALLPDDKLVGAGNAMQFLPRYVYDPPAAADDPAGLFDEPEGAGGRRHNVTDHALALYRQLDPAVEKDDIFFYVYGVLHSPDYRAAFANDLRRSLPRIPKVASAQDFWAFSRAGRDLSELHAHFEAVEPWPGLVHEHADGIVLDDPAVLRVVKMKHPKVPNPVDPKGAKVEDRTRIVFNEHITISGIPERAYDYELGSRSALGWVIEANRVKTDGPSKIVNDPNTWGEEHGDSRYLLDLVGRVVAISMRTLDIVDSLPGLDLRPPASHQPGTWERAHSRLDELAALPFGWVDDGYGEPPSPAAREITRQVLLRLEAEEITPPLVFATPEGGLQLEWHRGSLPTFSIHPDRTYLVHAMATDGQERVHRSGSTDTIDDAIALVVTLEGVAG